MQIMQKSGKNKRQWAVGCGHKVLYPPAYCQLPTAFFLPPSSYRLLPTANCLPPTAFFLPPTAYRLQPTALT